MTANNSSPATLTEKDLRLIRLVAACRSNAEIAAELNTPVETLKSRLAGLHRRIGSSASSDDGGTVARVRMVAWAYENGLMGRFTPAHPAPPVQSGPAAVSLPPALTTALLDLCRAIVDDQPRGDLRVLAKRALQVAGGAR